MKTIEKIYIGFFTVTVLGTTLYLNSPAMRRNTASKQIVTQQNLKYDPIKKEVTKTQLVVKEEE